MVILFDLLARLPLSVLHRLGTLIGWVIYVASSRYAARLRENLQSAGLERSQAGLRKLLHANIRESGKGVLELPWCGGVRWGRWSPASSNATAGNVLKRRKHKARG